MTTRNMNTKTSTSGVSKKKKQGFFQKKWVRCGLVLAALMMLLGAVFVGGIVLYISKTLPQIDSLGDYSPPVVTTVYADDGQKIAEFFKERRKVLPYDEIPERVIQAFMAAEDARFFEHSGVDFISVGRAILKNLQAGKAVQGGSTITQQVTKSFFLSPERSYERKIKEALLAQRIEKRFSKKEILYLYLNQIYLGHGSYGVEAAAESYFGKTASELTIAECAILAGLPQAPTRYSPFRNMDMAKKRQRYVLNRMVADKYIAQEQADRAYAQELVLTSENALFFEKVPYFSEYIRQQIEEKYGTDALYTGGLNVYTTVNVSMQKIAQQEIEKGLHDLEKRQGFSSGVTLSAKNRPKTSSVAQTGALMAAVVTRVDDSLKEVSVRMGMANGLMAFPDMSWAKSPETGERIQRPGEVFHVGDTILVRVKGSATNNVWPVSLEQTPVPQAALICIETKTGYVKTMIGGRDFRVSAFNRAIQARRQPGSSFKPIVYAAALDKGFTPSTQLVDEPVSYIAGGGQTWRPKNYGGKHEGAMTFRRALEKSNNIISVKILQAIGPATVSEYAKTLGIRSPIPLNLSIALGSAEVSLLEQTRAFSVFANQGDLIEPIFILRVEDAKRNILEENKPARIPAIEPSTAFVMTKLLEGVVNNGTGGHAKAVGHPVAGKTGTTNSQFDTWFIGYSVEYVTGVWVGFDTDHFLGSGETGGRTALPIWTGFMTRILHNKPVRAFDKMPDTVEVRNGEYYKTDLDPEDRIVLDEMVGDDDESMTATDEEKEDFFMENM